MNKKDKDELLVCRNCGKVFTPKRKDALYCHRSCKDKHMQEKRKEATRVKREIRLQEKLDRQDRFLSQSPFGLYLVGEVKRAGTLEILAGHTPESLLQLLQLTRLRTRYSGITAGEVNKLYELSHIVGVKDKGRLGLLHPSNIVICPRKYNRERGVKVAPLGAGLSIQRKDLLLKHAVGNDEKSDSILKKIKSYLGKRVLNGFYKESKLTRTKRNTLIGRLNKYSSLPGFPDLGNMDNEELTLLLLQFGEKSSHTFSKPSFSELEVALKEMIRNNKQESVLFWIVESLANSMKFGSTTAAELLVEFKGFEDFVLRQVWNQLHHEPYELGYGGKHLVECFTLSGTPDLSLKLDKILVSRLSC